jgi:hypothetical protein
VQLTFETQLGMHAPWTSQTWSTPHAVPSALFPTGPQVVTVSVELQLVSYTLHGSGVPWGVQAWAGTQAGMQVPALHTCPAPHAVPSALFPAATQDVTVSVESQLVS